MSVSKVKKRLEEMAAYLGRDATGLEKLKSLKDAVNELRTRIASSEANEAKAREHAEEMAKRARAAENELDDSRQAIGTLRQINSNLQRDLQSVLESSETESAEDDSTTTKEAELKRVIKRLRQKVKFCPTPRRSVDVFTTSDKTTYSYGDSVDATLGDTRSWNREDIAKGWTHDAIWSLGATVAILALMEGEVVIETELRMKDIDIKEPNSDESVGRQIIEWFRKNIAKDGDEDFYHTTGGYLTSKEVALIHANKGKFR